MIGIYYYKTRDSLPFYGYTAGHDAIVPRIGEWAEIVNGNRMLKGRVKDVRYSVLSEHRIGVKVKVYIEEVT